MLDTVFRLGDCETTGLEAEEHGVVEIATLDLIDDRLGEGRSSLVHPGRSIPYEASVVHGITDADVADAPDLFDVAPSIISAGTPDFFVAHNAPYDLLWLKPWVKVPVICTMRAAMRVWPEAKQFGLSYLRYWLCLGDLGLRALPRHRAPADCFVLAHVFQRLRDHASIEEMVAWTQEPPVMPRVPFGEHDGKLWKDVPGEYLDWLAFRSQKYKVSEDAKWNAKREIARRYTENCAAQILVVPTVAALEDWFFDTAAARERLGITKHTDHYDRIVSLCADRKAAILKEIAA